MKFKRPVSLLALVLLLAAPGHASIFGNVRGVVHDPQHRPVGEAQVTIRAKGSAWSRTVKSNAEGEFEFTAVPVGAYAVTVSAKGFQPLEQRIIVASGSASILHFQLSLQRMKQRLEVSGAPEVINPESSSSETLVNRQEIARTPGADRTNSLAMITDYVPGAYMVHDQLHVRGGHQVSWEVDGVPVPNTNIASNVGPQFDPKDVDYVEMKTGGYSAEYGDRTYGVFNVIPRTGFEYNNEGELVASYGTFNQTNDQLSFGSHSDRFAYYGSLSANRSDLGLMTPVTQVLHDMESGVGGFGSLIFNATPKDQLRLVASARGDHYQIPNTPEQQVAGIRDLDLERDAFVNFSWVHTFNAGALLTVSPFYHYNRADFVGGPNDMPYVLDNNRGSHYVGGQATLAVVKGKHNAQFGLETFAQHDDTFFGLRAAGPSGQILQQRLMPWGNLEALFLQDQYQITPRLSLNGGVRLTHYAGLLSENAASPRVGAALRLPKLGWILRGFYGRYYQAPPLDTVSGSLAEFALQEGFSYLPLHGERDEQYQLGLTVPFHDWVLDTDIFRTHARNFFDHDVIGNSNIFLPLTIQGARVQGWEATLRSPEIFRRARVHLAYSHQFAQGFGAVTGGLTDFAPPETGFFFLDHDQRNTLSTVVTATLPHRAWATATVAYGSGFLNGDGPAHLPAHTTFDASFGKSFGEAWSFALNTLNIANRRYLLDNSNTFGGTHYVSPREIYVELRYRFHF
ncbi:MAG: TonB-dependent receptor [Acidobacteria bacterium]|nr:TonB-dependent receptor [Acidobacteriota bacterium]